MSQKIQTDGYGFTHMVYIKKPLRSDDQVHTSTLPPTLHFHNGYEIMLITQGKYTLFAPREIYEGDEPCIVFFHTGTYHGCMRQDCERVNFKCSVLNYSQSVIDEIPPKLINIEGLHDKDVHVIPIDKATVDLLAPVFSGLSNAHKAHRYEDNISPECYGYLLVILNKVAELVRQNKAISFEDRNDGDSYIYKVVKTIMELVSEGKDVSISAIADSYFVSSSKLSKDFRKVMGMTVKSMVDTLVLERIKGMLRRGMSNTEVAEKCGFSSESYFIQFFYKHMGMSPGSYRKNRHTEAAEY